MAIHRIVKTGIALLPFVLAAASGTANTQDVPPIETKTELFSYCNSLLSAGAFTRGTHMDRHK